MSTSRSPAASHSPPSARSPRVRGRRDEDLARSIEAVRAAVRRQNGRESPIGPRAERTRDRLIAAADSLFCERGYNSVSAGDIASAVGVAESTLYQYFNGRSGVFMAVAGEYAVTMIASGVREWDPADGTAGFRLFIENYVRAYLRNAAFFKVWEEATQLTWSWQRYGASSSAVSSAGSRWRSSEAKLSVSLTSR